MKMMRRLFEGFLAMEHVQRLRLRRRISLARNEQFESFAERIGHYLELVRKTYVSTGFDSVSSFADMTLRRKFTVICYAEGIRSRTQRHRNDFPILCRPFSKQIPFMLGFQLRHTADSPGKRKSSIQPAYGAGRIIPVPNKTAVRKPPPSLTREYGHSCNGLSGSTSDDTPGSFFFAPAIERQPRNNRNQYKDGSHVFHCFSILIISCANFRYAFAPCEYGSY